ncbi:MAG: HAD family hydrolase [Anaerolineae bacterium]|jgi:HAD superfamily hydrolase (TIGR01509 family)|nr:HAD family hydrolase [Chloroflexota bacterium]
MRAPRPIPVQEIRAILFDLDGTLIESDDQWVASLARRLRFMTRICRRVNTTAVARWLVMTLETPSNYFLSLVEHLGLSTSFFGLTDRLRKARGLATRGQSEAVPGSYALLEALRPDFKLAVVTTRARPEAKAFLEHCGIAGFFDIVVTRQDVLRMKPHPEPVQLAARQLGVPTEVCLMVGDTVNDVLSARRAGAYALGVLSGFGMRRELERSGADVILESAPEMLKAPFWRA